MSSGKGSVKDGKGREEEGGMWEGTEKEGGESPGNWEET